MYAKIQIKGIIEVATGMHIGGSSAFSAIGAVDSPVMKDARSNLPLIPGSSLKGKMRTLLAKSYNKEWLENRDMDDERILRLFGCTKNNTQNDAKRGRLLFTDMIMSNAQELRDIGINSMTEIKFENNISRTTAMATPRQIERVIRGAEFPLDLIYDVEEESEAVEDFKVLADGFRLLQYDYIGGHGSRGYGKIQFRDLTADVVIGTVNNQLLETCRRSLEEVAYAK